MIGVTAYALRLGFQRTHWCYIRLRESDRDHYQIELLPLTACLDDFPSRSVAFLKWWEDAFVAKEFRGRLCFTGEFVREIVRKSDLEKVASFDGYTGANT